MNTHEFLTQFCGTNENRPQLIEVQKANGNLYATNGEILICMPDDGTVPDPAIKSTIYYEGVIKRNEWSDSEFIPLTIPSHEKKICERCEGTGKRHKEIECPDCDGDGWFTQGNHDYDCLECDGTGEIPDEDVSEKVACKYCDGSGIGFTAVELPDGRKFQLKYLNMIASISGICYLPDDSEFNVMRFKFDGGIGLLMPCRD